MDVNHSETLNVVENVCVYTRFSNFGNLEHQTVTITETRKKIAGWINEILKRRSWSMLELSKRSKVAVSTIKRAREWEDADGFVTKTSTIQKIAAASGVEAPRFDVEGTSGFKEPEVTPLSDAPNIQDKAGQIEMFAVHTRALDRAGIVPGDTIWVSMGTKPKDGQMVMAQVYDVDTGGAETVLRRYFEPYHLTAQTSDPNAFYRPLLVDNNSVHIIGVIVKREWVLQQAS